MSKASSVGSRKASPGPMETETDCPLCLEEMDASDCRFKPCPCGYQICRFCWHRIREEGNERCPACRKIYTDEDIEFVEETTPRIAPTAPPAPTTPTPTAGILATRRHLAELRVIQKNLVYVIGISARIAHEHILRESEYFGQFGKILKIVVNRRNGVEKSSTTTSGSAYVTFARADEAARAISLVDGSVFDGRILRATYGTTKYCSFYLRGVACPNPNCMYLHEEGATDASYTKEELTGKMHLHSNLVADESNFRPFGTIMQKREPIQAPSPPPEKVVSPINLAQCADEAASFLSRLSRWNPSIDIDLEPPRSPRPYSEPVEDMAAFDPFAAPVKKRHLWPAQEPAATTQATRFEASPMIAKGTLQGFDWSPVLREQPPEIVTFKKSSSIRPVGSPVSAAKSNVSALGLGSSFSGSAAPGFENAVASPAPHVPANLEHLFGLYSGHSVGIQSPRERHVLDATQLEQRVLNNSQSGRPVLDATQLERQFFHKGPSVMPTIAENWSITDEESPIRFNMAAALSQKAAGKTMDKTNEKTGDKPTEKSVKTKPKIVEEITGKKVAPAPLLPPVRPIILKKPPLPATNNGKSAPATPKQTTTSRLNHFAVLDEGSPDDSIIETVEPATTPAAIAASKKSKKQPKKIVENQHKPMPPLVSQPAYTLAWPTKPHYTAVQPPRFAMLSEEERVAFRRWLDGEEKVMRREEAQLRANVAKMHGDLSSWINSIKSQ